MPIGDFSTWDSGLLPPGVMSALITEVTPDPGGSEVRHYGQEWFRFANAEGDIIDLRGPIWVTGHDGLGIVRARTHVEAGPQQHGQTLAAAYLEPRVVTLQLRAQTASEPALQTQRDAMALMFNRPHVEIYLDIMMPSGTARRLDCRHHNGYTAPRDATTPYFMQTDVMQLIADNPILYDVDLIVEEFTLGPYYAGSGGMFVDTEVPTHIGTGNIIETRAIVYAGTWLEYPIVRFNGPCANPRLENVTTGEVLEFEEGTEVNAFDYLEIDTRYGFKTVSNSVGESRIDELTETSDLATFHIAPHPEALGGINDIQASCTDATANTEILLQYRERWFLT